MSDFVINAKARAVMTRHWIETEQLSVSAVNGTLFIRGVIRYRAARERQRGEIKADLLAIIDRELRSIPAVRRIQFQLDNWLRDETGGWTRVDGRAARRPPGSAAGGRAAAPTESEGAEAGEDAEGAEGGEDGG